MGYKLRSRTQSPPNGFIWVQRETGWDNRKAAPASQWDFSVLCREIQSHRRANHARFPWLTTDYAKIEAQVDRSNAERVSRIAGAESYIVSDEVPVPPKTIALPVRQQVGAALAGLAKAVKGGAVLLDWERSGDPPVDRGTAESRAVICVKCPKNGKGDLTRFFTVPASEMIRKQMERSTSLKLSTSVDDQLGVCEACLCPIKLKVWAPLNHIVNNMPDSIKAELDPGCWVLAK